MSFGTNGIVQLDDMLTQQFTTADEVVVQSDGSVVVRAGWVNHRQVFRITPGGGVSVAASGLTAILGLDFDALGRMYVLETSTGNTPTPPFLVPGSGRVLRLTSAGREVVATGLTSPTAMAFGPDNRLYVSHRGYGLGPAAGLGEILRVDVGLPRGEDD